MTRGGRSDGVADRGWSPGSRAAREPPHRPRMPPALPPGAGCASASRQLGTGFGFGIFIEGRFAGEITLSSIQRGPFQNGSIGYWIDEELAGSGYTPEAVIVTMEFAFETLRLHRVEIAIIPRNTASRTRSSRSWGSATRGSPSGISRSMVSGRTTSATQ